MMRRWVTTFPALSLLLLLAAGPALPAAAQSPCSSPPCHRAYLPLVGGRLRVDLGEYGPTGPPWEHLGMTDRVLDLAYDQAGKLWAATLGGLVEWPAQGGEPLVHTHRPISQVAVDGEGGVWFGGYQAAGGVERVEPDPLERLAPDGSRSTFDAADGLPQGWLQELAVDEGGRIYASWGALGDPEDGRAGGLARWDPVGGWRVWPAEAFTSGGAPWALCPDGQGGMWLAGGRLLLDAPETSDAWLRRLDPEGRLMALEALPSSLDGQAVYRLAAGPGAKLYAIVAPRGEGLSRHAMPQGGPVPRLDSSLAVRSAAGDWTLIDLPLDQVDEARLEPQGFVSGPRDLAVDARGTVWLVWEGALMALGADGGMSLYPAPAPDSRPNAVILALSQALIGSSALAPRPGGGLALGSRRARGVAMVARGAAPALRGGPLGIPARLFHLWPGAGGLYALGDADGRRGLWWLGPRAAPPQAAWAAIDTRIPDGGIGLWTMAAAADGSYWISDGEFLLHTGPGRQRLETFGPGRGLPGGVVTRVAQAPDGAIWVGTQEGLVRRQADGTWVRLSLPPRLSAEVADIAFAADGSAWVALSESVSGARILQGGLLLVGGDGRRQDWSSGDLIGIEEVEGLPFGQDRVAISPSGRVFTSGDIGVFSGDGLAEWQAEKDLPSEGGPLVFDRQGRLWTFDWEGSLLRYDPSRQRSTAFGLPTGDTHQLQDLALDPQSGDLVMVANPLAGDALGAVMLRRSAQGSWTQIDLAAVAGRHVAHDWLRGLAVAPDGSLLAVSSEDRLLVYGAAGIGAWEPQDRLTEGGSLSAGGCVDPSGRLWLPYRDGLSSFLEAEGWRHFRSADGLPPQADGGRVHCAPDGSLWLTRAAMQDAPPAVARWSRPGGLKGQEDALGLRPGEGVLQLAWSADGRLAALTTAGGHDNGPALALLIRRPGGGMVRHAAAVLAQAQATDLSWAPDGRLWIATDRGPALLNPGEPDAQLAWDPSRVVLGRGLLDLAWQGARLWAVGPEGAAERLEDGRWRPYTQADGLSGDRLRQAAPGPAGDWWLLNQAGGVDRLAR